MTNTLTPVLSQINEGSVIVESFFHAFLKNSLGVYAGVVFSSGLDFQVAL